MSEFCKIELALKEKLESNNAETLWANYVLTRGYLFKNIYPEIGKKLPDFTYHDGSHVINVLDNIFQLLDVAINNISYETLYFLCLSTLFHDVGLVYGRKNHQKKIGDIYNSAVGKENIQKFGNEKIIITKIVEAHSGKAIDETYDTLKYLGTLSGYSEPIITQKIAAILKFADELAEGGHRTSDYLINKNMYKKNSKIFHKYSQAYQSVIDNENSRIAITFNIIFSSNDLGELIIDHDINLEKFIDFIFDRIIKIDDERKYCRYYCRWLDSMKEVSIKFNFWYNGDFVEVGLDPLVLSDKIIPGDFKRKIPTLYPSYSYSSIDGALRSNIGIKSIGVII